MNTNKEIAIILVVLMAFIIYQPSREFLDSAYVFVYSVGVAGAV